jgi:hypothetical protein
MRLLWIVWAALVWSTGCQPSCEELCVECTGDATMCNRQCTFYENTSEVAGCLREFDELIACGDEVMCDSGCQAVEDRLGACIGAYCDAHPGDPHCVPGP